MAKVVKTMILDVDDRAKTTPTKAPKQGQAAARKRRVNAIADAAVGALLGSGKGKEQKPYFLARGRHRDPLTGEETVTVINGIRPDRMSPAAKRALLKERPTFHALPIQPVVTTVINLKSGKTHDIVQPRLARNGRPIVQTFESGWQTELKDHRRGPAFMTPQPSGRQRRLMRRYRIQNPTMNTEQLAIKIVKDAIARAKKLEARIGRAA